MRPLLIALLVAGSVAGARQSDRAPAKELDHVVAFTRLYGPVRYFYPSDAAASIDWNRFAVEGVRRARTATNAKALESALEELFSPLGPGIEIGAQLKAGPAPTHSGGGLIAWRYLGPGFDSPNTPSRYNPYRGKRTNRSRVAEATIDGFVTLMQTVPAADLAGKRIRLRGQVRAKGLIGSGSAALWLRVDRGNQGIGFFDNMNDRPIRYARWREYVIDGPVADDATSVAFGIMASGNVAADFDAIELAVLDANGRSSIVAINDAGFENAMSATSSGWMRAGTSKNAEISRPAGPAPEGRQFARLSAPSATVTEPELFDDSAPMLGEHVDIDLGAGLKARVPLVLSETEAAAGAKNAIPMMLDRSDASAGRSDTEPPDLNLRLADVVVAWNVFRHFYPYWTEAAVDWDVRLRTQLEGAYSATSRAAQRDALRLLVADARDGHGGVIDTQGDAGRAALPLRLGLVEGQVAVIASGVPADAPVGAVVSTIDGRPAAERLTAAMRLASGTAQWKEVRALQEISTCPSGAVITLVVTDDAGPRTSALRCDAKQPPGEPRPQPVTELKPGVWYVDLTRARMSEVKPMLQKLAAAAGVLFDVRGYPTDAGVQMLPHLLDGAESDRWMHVAKIVGPFGRSAGWHSVGWNLKPSTPRLSGKIVFLTDGRAISYAESVMGYVADRKLGTIVGGATAGANGNVAMFSVPGGFRITFTGMRVTGHDGRTPHHLAGIKPDVPVVPTIAGLRAGRDEVLERGVALVRP